MPTAAEKKAAAAAKKAAKAEAKKSSKLASSYTFKEDTTINIGSICTHILPAGIKLELNEDGTYGEINLPAEYLPE